MKRKREIHELTTNSHILNTFSRIIELKQLYRQGWLHKGVAENACESVAEHSFGVAVLAMLLLPQLPRSLNASRVLSMALLHESGEVYAGDVVPA
ncbi:MAG: HD domain-containing protein, partial [Candidatus Cloacimonetes bacterium]|nr:HD domain-containing protein [Candidatus Cloacimonadota bacterium]